MKGFIFPRIFRGTLIPAEYVWYVCGPRTHPLTHTRRAPTAVGPRGESRQRPALCCARQSAPPPVPRLRRLCFGPVLRGGCSPCGKGKPLRGPQWCPHPPPPPIQPAPASPPCFWRRHVLPPRGAWQNPPPPPPLSLPAATAGRTLSGRGAAPREPCALVWCGPPPTHPGAAGGAGDAGSARACWSSKRRRPANECLPFA